MTRKRCTGKRWLNGDGGRWQLYLAEFTQGRPPGIVLTHVEAASAAFSAKRY